MGGGGGSKGEGVFGREGVFQGGARDLGQFDSGQNLPPLLPPHPPVFHGGQIHFMQGWALKGVAPKGGAPKSPDFLGKCVARASSFDNLQCQEL